VEGEGDGVWWQFDIKGALDGEFVGVVMGMVSMVMVSLRVNHCAFEQSELGSGSIPAMQLQPSLCGQVLLL
jgi:hypothetical protein